MPTIATATHVPAAVATSVNALPIVDEDTVPPPAVTEKLTATPRTPRPSAASTRATSGWASGAPARADWLLPAAATRLAGTGWKVTGVEAVTPFGVRAVIASASRWAGAVSRPSASTFAMLVSLLGMLVLASARDLVLLFVAFELMSIPLYVLAGFVKREGTAVEAALKFFLVGSVSSAVMAYGLSFVYGAAGTTDLARIATTSVSPLLTLGLIATLVGLAFKIAAFPFHMWVPDVYEGAPTSVTAFMSAGPKVAGFAVLLRVFLSTFEPLAAHSTAIIACLAVLTMAVGNIMALSQTNIKRMLAYSSIAHAGYLLVAFAAAREIGISAAIFYATTYAAMNVGAFAIISHFAGEGERFVTFDDFAGLGRRSPVLAACLTIFLLSLIGIPLTGGFFAKFYVFSAALQANLIGLTIIGNIDEDGYLRASNEEIASAGRGDVRHPHTLGAVPGDLVGLVLDQVPWRPATQAEGAEPGLGVHVPAGNPGDARRDVGQDHHRKLEPLGLVHAHDANTLARLLDDGGFGRLTLRLLPEPLDEAAKRDAPRGLVGPRKLGHPLVVGFQRVKIAPLCMLFNSGVHRNYANPVRKQANELDKRSRTIRRLHHSDSSPPIR